MRLVWYDFFFIEETSWWHADKSGPKVLSAIHSNENFARLTMSFSRKRPRNHHGVFMNKERECLQDGISRVKWPGPYRHGGTQTNKPLNHETEASQTA